MTEDRLKGRELIAEFRASKATHREVRRLTAIITGDGHVRILKNISLIGSHALTIVLQLVDEHITEVGRVAFLALAQERDCTVGPRLKLNRIVPKGMVLDDHRIHTGRVALASRAANGVRECDIPFEATMFVCVFHGGRWVGVPNADTANQRLQVEARKDSGHLRRKRVLTMLMVVVTSADAIPERMKQAVIMGISRVFAEGRIWKWRNTH